MLLKTDYYLRKMGEILNDSSKFKKLTHDPTEKLKQKVNGLIDSINLSTDAKPFNKLIGHYEPGYTYGNPKIHKNLSEPELRPIISQIGTPTYDISKIIHEILKKYVPLNYAVNSTEDFLNILRNVPQTGLMASLDVSSLFTSVPVRATIDILLEYAYNSVNIAPPKIPKYLMEELLLVCTTETPFRAPCGELYLQIDGVSMGSPLGPLFANAYVSHLEDKVFGRQGTEFKSLMYCRYADDAYLICKKCCSVEDD